MKHLDICRVIATDDDGNLCGVRPYGAVIIPRLCPLAEAQAMHRKDAEKLRRWALAHGLKAKVQMLSKHQPKGFRAVSRMLNTLL